MFDVDTWNGSYWENIDTFSNEEDAESLKRILESDGEYVRIVDNTRARQEDRVIDGI